MTADTQDTPDAITIAEGVTRSGHPYRVELELDPLDEEDEAELNRLRQELATVTSALDLFEAERDSLAARLADAEKVVEAAKAWQAAVWPRRWRSRVENTSPIARLLDAVDAYQSTRADETYSRDGNTVTWTKKATEQPGPGDIVVSGTYAVPPLVLGDQVLVDQPKEGDRG